MEFFRKLKSVLWDSIKREQLALLMVILFSITTIILYLSIADFNGDIKFYFYNALKAPLYYFTGLLLPMGLIILLGLIRFDILRRLLIGLVVAFYGIIFIVDIFLWQNFGSLLNDTKIKILLTTDVNTSIEFLKVYAGFYWLFIIALIIAAIYILLPRLKVRIAKINCLARLELIILLIGAVAGSIFGASLITNDMPLKDNPRYDRLNTSTALLRVPHDFMIARRMLGDEKTMMPLLDARMAEEDVSTSDDIPYVIFILGESTDRNKMSAYGYKNDTTPLLNKRIASGETVLFTDTIACANNTATALSIICSFADKKTKIPWYENGCIVDIFTKAGFYTSFLSSQSPSDKYGNMDGILAKRSAEFAFTSEDGPMAGLPVKRYDNELLPLLDRSLANNSNAKSFYIVHLTGTHEEFKLRYPKEFAKFTADDEDAPQPKWREVKAEYDNAVLYNDYIIDEIIRRFTDKNAILIYISDHGDDVYDNPDGFMGHSEENKRSPHMIEIPMLVWGSNSFWSSHSELKQELIAAKDRPYSTENVIHFIFDLAGIKTSSYDSKKSILNPDNIYQHQPRIYGGVPYHKE